jgi:uncharacterized protein YwgA
MRNKKENSMIKVFICKFLNMLRRNDMDRERATAGLLKRIDTFNVNSFSDRLRVQKIIFLLYSLLGLKQNYPYTMYVRGPYSPALTKDFYEIKDTNLFKPAHFLDENVEKKFKIFIEQIKPISKDDNILELLATLSYIENNIGLATKKEMISKLKIVKPDYPERTYESIYTLYANIKNTLSNGENQQ